VDVGGDVEEQIAGGFDLQVAEQSSALGTNAANILHRSQQPIGGDVVWGNSGDGGSGGGGRIVCRL
jgi:hypothetical protein